MSLLSLPSGVWQDLLLKWFESPMLSTLCQFDDILKNDTLRLHLLKHFQHLKQLSSWQVKDIGFSWLKGFYLKKLILRRNLFNKEFTSFSKRINVRNVEEVIVNHDIPIVVARTVIKSCLSMKKITIDLDEVLLTIPPLQLQSLEAITITRVQESVNENTLCHIAKYCHNLKVFSLGPASRTIGALKACNEIIKANTSLEEIHLDAGNNIFSFLLAHCNQLKRVDIRVTAVDFPNMGNLIKHVNNLQYLKVDTNKPCIVYEVQKDGLKIIDVMDFPHTVAEMESFLVSLTNIAIWRLFDVPLVDNLLQTIVNGSFSVLHTMQMNKCEKLTKNALQFLLSNCKVMRNLFLFDVALQREELTTLFSAAPTSLRFLEFSAANLNATTVMKILYSFQHFRQCRFYNVYDDTSESQYDVVNELRRILLHIKCTCRINFITRSKKGKEFIFNGKTFRGTNVNHYLTVGKQLKKKKLSRSEKHKLNAEKVEMAEESDDDDEESDDGEGFDENLFK